MVTGKRVVLVGGSAAGLCTGLLLARTGHTVTVVDPEPLVAAPDIETAAATAFRASAPQIVQPHALIARCRQLLAQRLPDVLDALLAAGAVEAPLPDQFPPSLRDREAQPGDDQLTMILTRRSTVDWVVRRAAAAQPGLTLLGGRRVTGLIGDEGRPPHVRGVGTADGGPIEADVVVDATGRRSQATAWLAALGAVEVPRQLAECGLAYYSRHYRRRPGADLPGSPRTRVLLALDEFTTGLWSGDNETMVFAVAPLVADQRFRTVTDPDVFTAVLRTVPPFAPWLDVIEPISDIYVMGGLHNTLRRLVVDGAPAATGLFAVGDSVCTTNPTLGRGLPLALQGAADLADVLGEMDDPHEAALEADRRIQANIEPFFVDQARNDAARLAALRHTVLGQPAPEPRPSTGLTFDRLRAAAMLDPVAFRAFVRMFGMLDLPDAVYADEQLAAHVDAVLSRQRPPRPPQPSRAELLAALGGAPEPERPMRDGAAPSA